MRLDNYLLLCISLCERLINNPYHKERIEYYKGKKEAYSQVYRMITGAHPCIMGNENEDLVVNPSSLEK